MLIWTLAALFGMGVTLAAATATFYQLAKLGRRNRERLVASQAGQRELERLRAGGAALGQHESPCEKLTAGRTLVTVTPDAKPGLRQVRVEVLWRDPDGERRMVWSTLVNP